MTWVVVSVLCGLGAAVACSNGDPVYCGAGVSAGWLLAAGLHYFGWL